MTLMLLAGPGLLSALSQAHAIERDEARLNSVESAVLLLRGPDGEIEGRAIELGVDVAVSIGGVLAHVAVSQEFRNDGKAWAEGIYVFSLPDKAAVDSLEIRIGERVVKGIVQERGKARVSYETAKARGQRGALVSADPNHLLRAARFVAGLEASGGTEMYTALDAALTGEAAAGHLRQIVFVTDGSVGNETEIFRLIERKAGDARLFTVGIGSAPNTSFMSGAARFGRGTFTLIGSPDEVEGKMTGLLSRLEHPMVTDIEVDWPAGADVAPARLPDLYAGEPLVVSARLPGRGGEVVVRGTVAGSAWTRVVRVDDAVLQRGASKIWARLRIGALMDAVTRGEDQNRVHTEVTALGLRHQLVTRYTSLVAVESAPTRPSAAHLRSETVPQMLPAGQRYTAIFGGFPATATPAAAHLAAGGVAAGVALLLVGWRRSGNRRTRA